MADATVTLSADLSQLRRELALIPNLSSEAAQKTLISLERTVQKAERASKRATAAIAKDAKRQSAEMERAYADVQRGAEKVFGGIVGDVVDVGDAITALGAGGAIVAGIGLAVGAIAGIGLAAVDSIRDVEAMRDRLAELGVVSSLTADDLRGVEAAAASLDTLEGVGIRIREAFAGAAAPGIREASQAMLNGADAAEWFGAKLGQMTTNALRGAQVVVEAYRVMADVLGDLGLAAAIPGVAFVEFASRLDEVADGAVDNVRAGAAVQASLAATAEATDDATDKAGRYAAATREAAAATDVFAKSLSFERLEIDAELERLEALEVAREQATAERQAAHEQLIRIAAESQVLAAQIQAAARDMMSRLLTAAADSLETVGGTLAGGISELATAVAESGRLSEEAAMRAYKAGKAAALVQVAISTAAGVARQFSDLPFPAALVTSIGVAAAGAAQAITIATTPPPQFYAGGLVEAAGTPDATPAILHAGERVQTAASVRRETAGDVRARNSGMGSASVVQVQVQYGGRVLDEVIAGEAQRPGSALRATMGTAAYGQRRRYG